jgi:hypothetical protein
MRNWWNGLPLTTRNGLGILMVLFIMFTAIAINAAFWQ